MSPLLRASAAFLVLFAIAGTAEAAPPAGRAPSALPLFHGNWCGAGDAHRAAPVDALDAACRAHDLCYERKGRGTCSCDKAFLRATARVVANRGMDEALRSKAATANSFFSATPCVEPTKAGARSAAR